VTLRRPAVALLAVALLGAAACASGGGTSAAPMSAADAARLQSVMAGSDRVLPEADVVAANVIGLDLVTLTGPLTGWWDDLTDPDVARTAWLARAPERIETMRRTVEHMAEQLGPGRAPTLRETYQLYVDRWRDMLDALEALLGAVAAGDRPGQERATEEYNRHLAAIVRADRIRVERVVRVYGPAEAARALKAQGLDPAAYGL
jgi:hypothetical protein